jgi:hypothetical protein
MNHLYKYPKSSMSWVIAFSFGVSGILLLLEGLWYGTGLLLLSLFLFILRNGIETDIEKKVYRIGIFFGNICIGSWKALPEIRYVSVFRTVVHSSVASRSNREYTKRELTCLISLVHGKNSRLVIEMQEGTEVALKKAGLIAARLGVKVWDATERQGKWAED